jgi:ATP-dependent RNA helicase DDX27
MILFGLMGLKAAELHGNLTQLQRLESLEKFRDGEVQFLLATDLASRGLDILGCEHVINFDMPRDLKSYVHRVGRTARAGRNGIAVSLVGETERKMLRDIAKHARSSLQSRAIPSDVLDHFADKIRSLEGDVSDIKKQEKEEHEIRVAEMEANKALNMMKHKDQITNRGARTWFQTEKEKRQVKRDYQDQFDDKLAPTDPTTGKRKKKTRGDAKALKRAQLQSEKKSTEKSILQGDQAVQKSSKSLLKRKVREEEETKWDNPKAKKKKPKKKSDNFAGQQAQLGNKSVAGMANPTDTKIKNGRNGKGKFKSKQKHNRRKKKKG